MTQSIVGKVALLFVLAQGSGAVPSAKTLVVRWNEEVLELIRHAYLGPPMVARALAIVHTCMYDAWSVYDSSAVGTQLDANLRQPSSVRTDENKRKAISYAAYRAAADLFPGSQERGLDDFMRGVGYDPANTSLDPRTPAGIGNLACAKVLAFRHQDGANQLGDLDAAKKPYSDYTGYVALNESTELPLRPGSVRDPNRFQPIVYRDPSIRAHYPMFVGAQWFKVISFAGPYDSDIKLVYSQLPPERYGSASFMRQAGELVELSANLTDEQKMISEYWSDGPHSELPPGHWCLFAQFVSERDHHSVDDDVKLFFVLTNAGLDASIACWQQKRDVDSVRPITAIANCYRGKSIRAWGGPGKGTVLMDGGDWMPYQPNFLPTPPFPEYPSGHSTFSAAAALILQLWTASDRFGFSTTLPIGSSRIEPGVTPASDIILEWPTFSSAADQAGMSRRYGGIHFQSGDLAGRALGKVVAQKVWDRASAYFCGQRTDAQTYGKAAVRRP